MAGIYLHIPFCRQKCHYCDFYSQASGRHRGQFTAALIREITLRKDYLRAAEVASVYFGGGTPSLLTGDEIQSILERIEELFTLSQDAEITLEANPEDLSPEKTEDAEINGDNRLSIGVQSLHDTDLNYLNRIHSAQRALDSIKAAQVAGFSNLSTDLIYGIPGLTNENWAENLRVMVELGVPHISAYSLTIEADTALSVLIRKGKASPVDETSAIAHYEILCSFLEGQGYEHYEVSNFARPGYIARHNSAYWSGEHYLGLGPSAHSYNGTSRQWNIASTAKYIESINHGFPDFELEMLSPRQLFDEYMMTSLRTSQGASVVHILEKFGNDCYQHTLKKFEAASKKGFIERKDNQLILTSKGMLFADGIAAEFFL